MPCFKVVDIGVRKMNYIYDEEKKSTFQKIIKEWPILLVEIVLAVILGFFVARYGLEKVDISDSSMTPILKEEDTILVNKMAYMFFNPSRDDVIVFRQDGQEHSYYSVKRVVALPGESVQIIDGALYVNDKPYHEKNQVELMITAGIAEEKVTLEAGEYFVLGDNRNQSEDSRYSSVGMIREKDIVGKAWIRLKPSVSFVSWLKYENNSEETE